MSFPRFIATIALSALVGAGVFSILQSKDVQTRSKESAYARVLRTGTLRCGYGLWEPLVMRDPNTGQFSGVIYDFMQAVGKALNVKVEYVLETPWDSIGEALIAGKIDAHCAGVWATPPRGRVMAFSNPLFFASAVAFARADDDRFDNNLARINQPDITAALSDDDITTEIYAADFPKAKSWVLPQFAPREELLLAVATHKADVTFNSPPTLHSFEKSYAGQIKIIPTAKPLRIYPDTIAVKIDEQELLHMLNTAIDQMLDSGAMDKLVSKYQAHYDMSFLVPVQRPYAWKQK